MQHRIIKWATIVILYAMIVFVGIVVFQIQHVAVKEDTRVYHIGLLIRGEGYESAVEGYQRKMAELGYIDGKNVHYDIRFVSDLKELEQVAEEFVAKQYDLIHTYSTPATKAAYGATTKLMRPIPIVFGSMGDPMISGVIKDIKHPGTNVTGVASLSTELTARRLELLKEIQPSTQKVALPHSDRGLNDVAANKSFDIAQKTAEELQIKLILFPIKTKEDNKNTAQKILRKDVDGILISGDSLVWAGLAQYVAQSKKEKLPLAAFSRTQVEQGALIGFGPDYSTSGEQAALITHQIFRGKNPADIAIQVPAKLQLMVNLDTAREIGYTFTDEFLKHVDVVIGGS